MKKQSIMIIVFLVLFALMGFLFPCGIAEATINDVIVDNENIYAAITAYYSNYKDGTYAATLHIENKTDKRVQYEALLYPADNENATKLDTDIALQPGMEANIDLLYINPGKTYEPGEMGEMIVWFNAYEVIEGADDYPAIMEEKYTVNPAGRESAEHKWAEEKYDIGEPYVLFDWNGLQLIYDNVYEEDKDFYMLLDVENHSETDTFEFSIDETYLNNCFCEANNVPIYMALQKGAYEYELIKWGCVGLEYNGIEKVETLDMLCSVYDNDTNEMQVIPLHIDIEANY